MNTGCSLEDLQQLMDDREEWLEGIGEILTSRTTLYIYIYIYIYIYVCVCVCVCVCVSLRFIYLVTDLNKDI